MPIEFIDLPSDMDQGVILRIAKEDDGDICLGIYSLDHPMVEWQACTPMMGGGRYPALFHTLADFFRNYKDDPQSPPIEQPYKLSSSFGTWQDQRSAIEIVDPTFFTLSEDFRTPLWNFIAKILKVYGPLYFTCFGCKTRLPQHSAYRCADCSMAYCHDCIRPHFEGKH